MGWKDRDPFSFVLSYEFPRLHLGSLCSFLNSRLLVEISWIRKQENMNSSNLCVETPSRVCLLPPPQEVVEEEVMRLMGPWGASLKSCLFALSFHVSQAVNLVTHPVSAKGWRAQTKIGMIQTAPGGEPDATLGGIKMRLQVPIQQSG